MQIRLKRILAWIGGHEPAVLVSLLVVAAGTWGFVALAGEVLEGDTQKFDEWSLTILRQSADPDRPIGPVWVAEVGRDLTALGGVAVLVLITAAVAGFLWLNNQRGMMWSVVIATASGLAVSSALKALIARPRPQLVTHLSHVYTTSFPSGHSMLSAVVYLTLGALLAASLQGRLLRAYVLSVGILLTVLVGLSRVYMGVHYPTDVLAGWTAGLVWAVLCRLVVRRLQRRGKVETAPADAPSVIAPHPGE